MASGIILIANYFTWVFQNFVRVLPWKLPAKYYGGVHEGAQSAAYNDCLYRNMRNARYVHHSVVNSWKIGALYKHL
jgi:hypothetical protein